MNARGRTPLRAATGLLGLALGAVLVLAPSAAAPAHAAGGDILISQDGVTWSTGLAKNVFDTSRMLVPGDSLQGSFYVKNDHDFPAYLRVGLSTLSMTDFALAQALSMTTIGTGASGASGSAASFSGTGVVCSDLLQREDPIPPGGVVLVTADLLFRQSTSGTNAQGEIAQIGFIVELSDVDLNVFGQPLCTNSLQIGPPDPNFGTTPGGGSTGTPPSGGGTGGSGGTSGGGTGSGGTGGTGAGGGAGDASGSAGGAGGASGTGAGLDRPSAAGTIAVEGVIGLDTSFFNTVRWWEEYAILVLIGAALLGMLGRVYAGRWLAAPRQQERWRPDRGLRVEQG